MQLLGQSAAWVGSEGEEQEGKAGTQSELGVLERQVQRPVAFRARRAGGEPAWANRREPTVRSERLKCSGFSADCLQPRVVFCSYQAEPQQEEPRPPGRGAGRGGGVPGAAAALRGAPGPVGGVKERESIANDFLRVLQIQPLFAMIISAHFLLIF